MKRKKIIITIVIITMLALFSGCNNVPSNDLDSNTSDTVEEIKTTDNSHISDNKLKYEALIYDFSDSVVGAKHEVEYNFVDLDKYKNLNPEKMLSVKINEKNITGDYSKMEYRGCNYFPVYRYNRDTDVTFEVDDNGTLISFFDFKTSNDGDILSKESCEKIATEFIKNIVDTFEYQVSVTVDEERKCYIVDFVKYVGSFKTTDRASVTIYFDGKIRSYSSYMLGRVSTDIDVSNIDLEEANDTVRKKLDLIYQDVKKQYDRINYGIPEFMLTVLKNGKIGLIATVDVNCINSFNEVETSISERINMVLLIS